MDNIDDLTIDNGNNISKHKTVFIGDVAVGKTSIIKRILDNKFKDTYEVIL